MPQHLAIGAGDVLLVVDLQNDFCPAAASRFPPATRS